MGVLVIASLPGPPRGWQTFGSRDRGGLQILALHGGNDRNVPPAVAQRFIEKAFGSDVLAPVDKHWYVLKDEDHVLHLDSSWSSTPKMNWRYVSSTPSYLTAANAAGA